MAQTITDPAVNPTGMNPPWLPAGAILNADGSVTLSNGTKVPGPPAGYTRDPLTGVIKAGSNAPLVPGLNPANRAQANPVLQPSAAAPTDAGAEIDRLYKQYGISDAGRGGGFADRAYWLEHPSEVLNGRLAADLAGTGSDQPTGTPGRGPWLNSGRNAPEASQGQATRTQFGGFWDPTVDTLNTGATTPAATTPSASSTTTGASTPGGPGGATYTGPAPGGMTPNTPDYDAQSTRAAMLDYLQQQAGGGAGGVDPTDPFGAKP